MTEISKEAYFNQMERFRIFGRGMPNGQYRDGVSEKCSREEVEKWIARSKDKYIRGRRLAYLDFLYEKNDKSEG